MNPTTFTHQPEARRTKKLNQVLTTRTQRTNARSDALTPWRLSDAFLTPLIPFLNASAPRFDNDRTLFATHFLTPFHHLLLDSLSRLRQTTAAVLAPPFAPPCVRETFGLSDSRLPHYFTALQGLYLYVFVYGLSEGNLSLHWETNHKLAPKGLYSTTYKSKKYREDYFLLSHFENRIYNSD